MVGSSVSGLGSTKGAATSPLFRFGTSCLLLLFVSCGYSVNVQLRIRLRVLVVSSEGRPVGGAELWLKDRNFASGEGPAVLQRPLGVTSSSGFWSKPLAYGYCYSAPFWEPYLKLRSPSSTVLSLEARRGGRLLAQKPIPPLTKRQIGGYDPVDLTVRLEGEDVPEAKPSP